MTAYKTLEDLFEKLAHLNHTSSILHWDEAVMMPSGGGDARAQAVATLESIKHELLAQPHVGELIETAKFDPLEHPWQSTNLKLMEKKYLNATSLPNELVKNLTQSAMQSEQAWRRFRPENNWQEFKPFLEKTLKFVKESATIRAQIFKKSSYDVLLDDFSPDISQKLIDPIFDPLKKILPGLIQKVSQQQKSDIVLQPQGNFPIEKQRLLGLDIMKALDFDFNRGRLDVSYHPFCGGVPQDVRITTRYKENEFISALMGVCHESGHARYEQNLPIKWLSQPVGNSLGMSVHESQSLLIEMQVCRSPQFMQFLSPLVKKQFGQHEAYDAENLYRLYTRVAPGLIRVDADEITYPLHIVLRYEIEKQLINGDLRVDDLPEIWDHLMEQFLGLNTKNNFKDGVMQDVHWPSGAFGYFPAYTLGRLLGAQLFATALKSHPDLVNEFAQGQFTTLFTWLKHAIYNHGSSVPFDALIKQATGKHLSPDDFILHVRDRYL